MWIIHKAADVINWAFDTAGKVKRLMTLYVGTIILIVLAGIASWLHPFESDTVQIAVMTLLAVIWIAAMYFVYKWGSKRLEHDSHAYDND